MMVTANLSPEVSLGEFLGVWQLIGDVRFRGDYLVASSLLIFFVPETARKRKDVQTAT